MDKMGIAQTPDELREHLAEQVGFLRTSAEAFDRGSIPEAKRLAHRLRVLLHNTKSSHALLAQLGVLERMVFFDSAGEIDPNNPASESNLTVTSGGHGGARYLPTLRDPAAMIDLMPLPEPWRSQRAAAFERLKGRPKLEEGAWRPFDIWWHAEEVLKDTHGTTFTRRALVLALAHKEGGSHVDPTLPEEYALLSRSNSLGWFFQRDGSEQPLLSPVSAAVRQIAYETDVSLAREFPGLGAPALGCSPSR